MIPTYKRPELLIECLRCLERQTIMPEQFEVIVVSDGYDPVTAGAISTYSRQSRLRISGLHTPGKAGPAAARNIGWRHARAPLIAFTDDDCRPDPGWLEAILGHHRRSNAPLMGYTGSTRVPLPEEITDFALNMTHLQTASFITANCACTREALVRVDGFDERFKAAWREDSDLEFKLLSHGIPIEKIEQAVVVHPVREQVPWGVSIREQKKGLYDALLYKKYPVLYRSRIQAQPLWYYYTIVASAIVFLVAFAEAYYRTAFAFGMLWVLMVAFLFLKRVKPVSKRFPHIMEMWVTSVVIPFVSVYWRLYGAVRYRVFFI